MKTTKSQLNDVSQILELEDNKVLVDLYGQHDENLAKIENNFGIYDYLQKLVDIDKRVFSEAMRDIDLFVGVCSILMNK